MTALLARGYHFDGINDEMLTPDLGVLGAGPFTVEYWAKGNPRFGQGSSGYGVRLYASEGGAPFAVVYNSGGGALIAAGGGTWDAGWHHLAFTVDGSPLTTATVGRVFIDGVLVAADSPDTNSATLPASGAAVLGQLGYSGGYGRSMMRDLRIWNRALSAAELGAFVPTLTGREQGLVGWWPLDGDTLDRVDRPSGGGSGNGWGEGEINGKADAIYRYSTPRLAGVGPINDTLRGGGNGRVLSTVNTRYNWAALIAAPHVPVADGEFIIDRAGGAGLGEDFVARYIDVNNWVRHFGGEFQQLTGGSLTSIANNYGARNLATGRIRVVFDGTNVKTYNAAGTLVFNATMAAAFAAPGGFGLRVDGISDLAGDELARGVRYSHAGTPRRLHGVAKNGARPALVRAVA